MPIRTIQYLVKRKNAELIRRNFLSRLAKKKKEELHKEELPLDIALGMF